MKPYAFLHSQSRPHKLFFSCFRETAFRTFYAGRPVKASSKTRQGTVHKTVPEPPAFVEWIFQAFRKTLIPPAAVRRSPSGFVADFPGHPCPGTAGLRMECRENLTLLHRAAPELFCARCRTVLLPQGFSGQFSMPALILYKQLSRKE